MSKEEARQEASHEEGRTKRVRTDVGDRVQVRHGKEATSTGRGDQAVPPEWALRPAKLRQLR